MRRLLLALLLFATPIGAEAAPMAQEAIAEAAITEFIRPSFEAFLDMASALETEAVALCATPSADALAAVRDRFLGVLDAFSRLSFLRFGPLARDNRAERLLLWPDPKGIALKQVQALLVEQPADALEVPSLQGKSVALQGFNALEFVLFGTGSGDLATDAAYRCGYGAAVAGAIRSVAEAATAEWRDPAGISKRLIEPSAGDADYRSVREVLEEFVGALSHGAEAIRDSQLLPFLGRDGEKPKPRSAPLWRSNGTVVLVAGGLKGITDFVSFSRIADAAGASGPFLANAIGFEARNVVRAEALITGTVEEAVNDPAQLQAFKYLVILTQSLQSLIGEQLSAALGLSVGFSSLDGD